MEETARFPVAPASDPDRPLDAPEAAEGDSRGASSGKQQLPVDGGEILRAMEIVERDSAAIAQSYVSLLSSLRLALAEASGNSVDHMQCFNDIAGCLQESVLDAAGKGNKFINSCLRLNEEMKGIESLAMHLPVFLYAARKKLRRNVDTLDVAVNRLLKF